MARRAIPANTLRASHRVVRPFLRAAMRLDEFFDTVKELTPKQRGIMVDQAILVLESFYAHLPLKRAMYAIDPLQRLRLLRHRLPQIKSDRQFHAEMTEIFTSLHDLHTNYLLPAPFNYSYAWLPFKVEAYWDGNRRKYLVTRVADWFTRGSFRKGVEILNWNGIPIERAVEMIGARSAGSNLAARHAQGLFRLTARPLIVLAPPDEEWVIVGYRTPRGRKHKIRVEWLVTELPPATDVVAPRGLSLVTDRIQQIRKFLFAPETVELEKKMAAVPRRGSRRAASRRASRLKGTQTTMPGVFRAAEVKTRHGTFGYIRIFSFDVSDADELVREFIRLVRQLPQNGLIIDVRDNGGGRAWAAERLLQLISPRHPIEPERLYFINTSRTLQLCHLQKRNPLLGPLGLSPWIESIHRSMETGAMYSASFPFTDPKTCNAIGRLYRGRVIVVTNALSYSATEFFAAGFQDHGGKVLGVDNATGGGGANVKTHDELRGYFKDARNSPFKALPRGAGLRVAYRRSLRVGPQIGTDVEDFGVVPDYFHSMTRNDLLKGNVDVINCAASLLVRKDFLSRAGT
jgi:Peptidase family S41